MTQKVFCIGFHRTGTTTFQTALEELGYRVVGMRDREWDAYVADDRATVRTTIEAFDGFRDMPWPLMYRWLAEEYSEAKFILSYRDPEPWIASCVGNYKDRAHKMFPVIYDVATFAGNEARCRDVYLRHIDAVRTFFDGSPRFLELDFTRENDWSHLCGFLGKPQPQRHFPHANKRPTTLVERARLKLYKTLLPAQYRRIARDR